MLLLSKPGLRHIRYSSPQSYGTVQRLQESIVSQFLASKPPSNKPAPRPTIITVQFNQHVYTCGRREIGKISPEQQGYLRHGGKAEFVEAVRGGQTTYHGPNQLVAYPILDLRAQKLTPRDYVCLLEKSLIATCARFGIKAMTTEHTGVWTTPDDKIASIGIHMRRNITSHGVALNISPDLWWFDRIVACGLEGKRATSFAKEYAKSPQNVQKEDPKEFERLLDEDPQELERMLRGFLSNMNEHEKKEGCGLAIRWVGEVFVDEMAKRLNLDRSLPGSTESILGSR